MALLAEWVNDIVLRIRNYDRLGELSHRLLWSSNWPFYRCWTSAAVCADAYRDRMRVAMRRRISATLPCWQRVHWLLSLPS